MTNTFDEEPDNNIILKDQPNNANDEIRQELKQSVMETVNRVRDVMKVPAGVARCIH